MKAEQLFEASSRAPARQADRRYAIRCSGFEEDLTLEFQIGFNRLKDDWLKFEKTAISTPFQSFAWLNTWFEMIGQPAGETPMLVSVRDMSNKLMFMLPLALSRSPVGVVARDMGNPVCDYHAPLFSEHFLQIADETFMQDLWREVLETIPEADLITLTKQPNLIGTRKNPMSMICKSDYFTPTAYQMHLDGFESWTQFFAAKRGGKARRTLNRKRNKLDKLGQVSFEAITEPKARREIIDALLDLKRADLERAGKPNIFSDRNVIRFLHAMCENQSENDCLVIHKMSCGKDTIALAFSLVWHGRLTYYIASYQGGKFAPCSPGLLALCRMFEWCIDEGHNQFDFTIGDEGYKLDWSDQQARLSCGTFAVTTKGVMGERLEAAKLSLMHTIKSTPAMYSVASRLLFLMRNPG